MIAIDRIKELLPHRYPMLLIDRVTELVPGERLAAVKAVTVNEPWYRSLPPGADEAAHDYPAALLVESWCQAAGLLAGAAPASAGGVPLLGGLSKVRFRGRVRPGDVIEHRVRIVRDYGENLIFEGESLLADRTVVEVGRATVALRTGHLPLVRHETTRR